MKSLSNLLVLFFFCLNFAANAQEGYWQQKIKYDIHVDFDTAKHQFVGNQTMQYWNNSPDTLERVYLHLYYNAFQPNSMMDVRSRTIEDPDSRVMSRIFNLSDEEMGFQRINSIKQDGKKVDFFEEGTILVVDLKNPLLPGFSTSFELDYLAQVPVQIRRTGRHNLEGIDYSMTQWYPKMCEYDKEGWHTNPYIGREFHGVWGDFNVQITIDTGYVIGGTGVLQNPLEIGHGYEQSGQQVVRKAGDKMTWYFKAENVHDFAWAADPNYAHLTDTLGNGMVFHFLFDKDTLYNFWDSLRPYAKQIFEIVNERFGEYPYPQYSVIQGGDGGMEYPMATLITAHGSFKGLVSVTAHEGIHSWYQGLLATNEAKYPWMDEGFTSFAQYYTLSKVWKWEARNFLARSYVRYARLVKSGKEEPLTTHADHYKLNGHYGTNSYTKGSIFLHQLSYIVGMEAFDKGMMNYFDLWHFKHPTPDDFKRVMERTSGLELDWYFEHWVETTNYIDYSIKQVNSSGKSTEITLERKGAIPMPIDIQVTLIDGTVKNYYAPLRIMRGEKSLDQFEGKYTLLKDWPWTFPYYEFEIDVPLQRISTIEIDPSQRMADINMKDNFYPSFDDIKWKH